MANCYLTIDDAPTSFSRQKLQFLNDNNIRAIWFSVGEYIPSNREALVEAIKSGHIVANHSLTHRRFSTISLDVAKHELSQTEQLIEELYKEAGVGRPAKFFRFPYGDQGDLYEGQQSTDPDRTMHRSKLRHMLLEMGFQPGPFVGTQYDREYIANHANDPNWGWSYDIEEWAIHRGGEKNRLSPEQVSSNLQHYLNNYDKEKNQIFLIHDHEETSDIFPELISLVLQKGIVFSADFNFAR